MRLLVKLLALTATACAIGWICGVRWCDVGFVATLGLALLLGGETGRA